jgi:transposase
MPYRYPPEFHRRVLDLVAAGRSVASIAADLGVSKQTVYTWRKQELSDTGVEQFLTTVEAAGLSTAKRRIAELESELAVTRRANELLKEQVVFPKGGSRRSR